MTQLVSLFSNQEKAGEATEALSNAELGETDVRIVEEWGEEIEEGSISVSAYNPYASASEQAGIASMKTWTLDLPEDEKTFISEAMKKGGALVVVEMPDEDNVSQAERILKDQGGQVTGR